MTQLQKEIECLRGNIKSERIYLSSIHSSEVNQRECCIRNIGHMIDRLTNLINTKG